MLLRNLKGWVAGLLAALTLTGCQETMTTLQITETATTGTVFSQTYTGWGLVSGSLQLGSQLPATVGGYEIVHVVSNDGTAQFQIIITGDYSSGWPADLIYSDNVRGEITDSFVWSGISFGGGVTTFSKTTQPLYTAGTTADGFIRAGTVTEDRTIANLILEAYKTSRIIAQRGETLDADRQNYGLVLLNQMLHRWDVDGIDINHVDVVLTDSFPYEKGHESIIRDCLAVRLAEDNGTPVSPLLYQSAKDGKEILREFFDSPPLLATDQALHPYYNANRRL